MFGVSVDIEDQKELNFIFWSAWLIIVLVLNIIMLNFIIAEAGASYNNVVEFIDEFVQKERSRLIAEAEDMLPNYMKKQSNIPKYIITREIDEW